MSNLQAACAQSILPSSTCSLTDVACLCADAPILGQIEQCSTANCTVIEALSKLEIPRPDRTMRRVTSNLFLTKIAFSGAFNATQTACGVTPTDLSQTYIIVTSIFLALAVLFYLIRLYVRPPLTPGFRIDDGIMLVATVRTRRTTHASNPPSKLLIILTCVSLQLTVVVFTALNLQGTYPSHSLIPSVKWKSSLTCNVCSCEQRSWKGHMER